MYCDLLDVTCIRIYIYIRLTTDEIWWDCGILQLE